jgi:cytochrome c oxidase cbb3-type subunit 3
MKNRYFNRSFSKGSFLSAILLLAAFPGYTQTTTQENTIWLDPLFLALAGFAVILGFVILVLGEVFKSTLKYKHQEARKTIPPAGKIILVLLAGMLYAQQGTAQTLTAPGPVGGMSGFAFYLLTGFIIVELLIVLTLGYTILIMLKPLRAAEETSEVKVKKVSLLEKLNNSVAIESEKDIILDHDYDGIRELDNNLPPWWKYGFYLTIVFAVIYLVHFHITGSGKLQAAEYEEQITTANLEIEEYKKKASNLVDENNVTMLTDKALLEEGKAIFISNCAACHGQLGEGGVGPNLTDDYWLHGGSIQDVFKSIKYGWPEKGMKSWQRDLSAKQIHEISSFIRSIHGTNPANAKEKQGELYTEQSTDSLTTTADTLTVAAN